MYLFDSLMKKINKAMGRDGYTAFLSVFVSGFFMHAAAMLMDAPNHDGLASMYFDQNMITSGRWFLGIACGISSYFSLPWLIGVLSLIYLGITAVLLIKLLEITRPVTVVLISVLLVSFPTVASMFAYVFTMDGYMLGLMLAVLCVLLTHKYRFGFIWGGLSLAFSMGIYQAYLPVAMILSLYMVLMLIMEECDVKDKLKGALKYVYMGVIGASLYYILLRVLLAVQGKELDAYQGINEMASAEKTGIFALVKLIYSDFFAFTLKSKILMPNYFAVAALCLLAVSFATILIYLAVKKAWIKSAWFYMILLVTMVILPICANAVMIVSSGLTYHLLMRYQWILLIILPVAFIDRGVDSEYTKLKDICLSAAMVSAAILAFSYILTDNIAYSNLQKKYEKTYAYCLRLADRIEQTEGYYTGMPVYMIGVVGEDNYPVTDITADVTDHMLGIGGDYLLYTGPNYAQFMKHYLGITMNIMEPGERVLYYEDWYVDMPSFPEAGSIKIVDGILCVKTENQRRPE